MTKIPPAETAEERLRMFMRESAEARAQASATTDHRIRENYLHIAHCWMDLALEVDRASKHAELRRGHALAARRSRRETRGGQQ
jgi:hypothetical protein